MKIGIYGGEAFPVYEIYTKGFTEIEVEKGRLERWKHAFDLFETVQQEIVQHLEVQGRADKVWANGNWIGFHVNENEIK